MITLEDQLKRTTKILADNNLTFALAGGVAASVYRDEERLTKDVDFIIDGVKDLSELGQKLLCDLGLKPHLARKADLDGGPLFAIKKGDTPIMAILGRDPEKAAPGVDFLLPSNPWVPRALERAQINQLDFGFARVPTMTIEDVVVAKIIASHRKEREQDILDLRGIFRSGNEIDLVYVIARMKEFSVCVPKSLGNDLPTELLRASKRIARGKRKSAN